MDWDLKMPPWEMAELERDSEPKMGSGSMADCSVDLKLGGLGDFASADKFRDQQQQQQQQQEEQRRQEPKMSTVVSRPGPSKRARAASNGSQNVSCLVDGCKSDLSNCREYHRRHKVCEVHSKTPMVMVGGQEQRFCQQCSRFHLLIEFDEVKRSCRKRLDGHNRRRRKPQPVEINPGSMFASHQGTRFSSYAQMLSTTSLGPNWTSIVKPEDGVLHTHHQQMLLTDRQQGFAGATAASLSSGSYYKSGRQFPFLHDANAILSSRTASETSACQPFLKPILASETSSTSSRTFSADCALTQVIDSDCALSLLSSPAQGSPGISHSRMISSNRALMAQPLVSGMQYESIGRYSSTTQVANSASSTGFSCSAVEAGHLGTVIVSDANETDELHCQETSHGFPFPWQ